MVRWWDSELRPLLPLLTENHNRIFRVIDASSTSCTCIMHYRSFDTGKCHRRRLLRLHLGNQYAPPLAPYIQKTDICGTFLQGDSAIRRQNVRKSTMRTSLDEPTRLYHIPSLGVKQCIASRITITMFRCSHHDIHSKASFEADDLMWPGVSHGSVGSLGPWAYKYIYIYINWLTIRFPHRFLFLLTGTAAGR